MNRNGVGASFLSPLLATGLLAASLPFVPVSEAADIRSFALVQNDGTLSVRRHRIRLYGVHIPSTSRICRTTIRPVKCAPRAALALNFRIRGFVECEQKWRNADGTITALCRADGEDLSGYLLSRGWALALPYAPFEYAAKERIARHHGLGVWGRHADVVQRRTAVVR